MQYIANFIWFQVLKYYESTRVVRIIEIHIEIQYNAIHNAGEVFKCCTNNEIGPILELNIKCSQVQSDPALYIHTHIFLYIICFNVSY